MENCLCTYSIESLHFINAKYADTDLLKINKVIELKLTLLTLVEIGIKSGTGIQILCDLRPKVPENASKGQNSEIDTNSCISYHEFA